MKTIKTQSEYLGGGWIWLQNIEIVFRWVFINYVHLVNICNVSVLPGISAGSAALVRMEEQFHHNKLITCKCHYIGLPQQKRL